MTFKKTWKLGVLLAGLLLSACSSKPASKQLRLYAFDCGRVTLTDTAFLYPGLMPGIAQEMSDECYLIEHPDGLLLWDTGLADAIGSPGIDVLEGAFHLRVQTPLMNQLAAIDIEPKDVDFIAMSHLHDDHVGNANAFASATLLIQREEHAAAYSEMAVNVGFTPEFYSAFAAEDALVLDGDHDVFGDGRVVVKAAPGHSPGHQALFVDLKQGPVLLAGDLYHFEFSRDQELVPSFNYNEEQTRASMERMEEFVAEKNAELWIPHDLAQASARKHAPAFYE